MDGGRSTPAPAAGCCWRRIAQRVPGTALNLPVIQPVDPVVGSTAVCRATAPSVRSPGAPKFSVRPTSSRRTLEFRPRCDSATGARAPGRAHDDDLSARDGAEPPGCGGSPIDRTAGPQTGRLPAGPRTYPAGRQLAVPCNPSAPGDSPAACGREPRGYARTLAHIHGVRPPPGAPGYLHPRV